MAQKNQRVEQLTEIQIAEIREIFTLFDKNSDGYVNTSELGTMLRALGMNPTQAEVKDMEKELDGNDTGSFDQMGLIGLIARKPRQDQTLEQMIEAVKVLSDGVDDKDKVKLEVSSFKYAMCSNGEKLADHEYEEVYADFADLVHDENVNIEDLANFLMSR